MIFAPNFNAIHVWTKNSSLFFQSNMEALRAAPVDEGETAASSVQVVSQALPKNSSNSFLKNIGIKPTASSKSAALNESDLREQLAAEARAAVQGELDALKKKSEEADEKLERQQKEMEEMRKQTEINQKEMQENNVLLRRLLSLNNASTWTVADVVCYQGVCVAAAGAWQGVKVVGWFCLG